MLENCLFGSSRGNNFGSYDHILPVIELDRDLLVGYRTVKFDEDWFENVASIA